MIGAFISVINLGSIMENQEEKHKGLVDELEQLYFLFFEISNHIGGRSGVSFKEEKGSLIIIKATLTIEAVVKSLPYSNFNSSKLKFWDIPTILILIRCLLETYLTYYYLCIQQGENNEELLKELLWEYQAEKERLKLLSKLKSKYIDEIKENCDSLYKKISNSESFNQLSASKRKDIRKGKIFSLITKEELADLSGFGKCYYNLIYKQCSSCIHTNGISLQYIHDSIKEIDNTLRFINTVLVYCKNILYLLIRDIKIQFSDVSSIIPKHIEEIVVDTENFLEDFNRRFE